MDLNSSWEFYCFERIAYYHQATILIDVVFSKSLPIFNALNFIQEIWENIYLVRFFHLIHKTQCFFIYSYSIFLESEAVIIIKVMSNNILHFRRKFVFYDSPQLLLYEIIDEIHALFHIVFIAAALDLSHYVEKFIKWTCVLSQYLFHIQAFVRI